MFKKILYLLIFATIANADSINWVDSYQDALNKAKVENKNIMILITTATCGWCKKMKSKTFVDKNIIDQVNIDYISLELTKGFDEFPHNMFIKSVPTTLFMDKNGVLIKKIPGYWNAQDFASWLSDVEKL